METGCSATGCGQKGWAKGVGKVEEKAGRKVVRDRAGRKVIRDRAGGGGRIVGHTKAYSGRTGKPLKGFKHINET